MTKSLEPKSTPDLALLTAAVRPVVGGMTAWFDQIARGLAERGWRVRRIGFSEFEADESDLDYDSIRYPIRKKSGLLPEAAAKWFRWRGVAEDLFERGWVGRPTALVSDSTPGVLEVASALSSKLGVPFAVLAGGDVFRETAGRMHSSILHRRIRRRLSEAAEILVDGPDLRTALARQGLDPKKVFIQYHGVDPERFGPDRREDRFFPPDAGGPRFVWHGRLVESGGPLRFVDAVSRIPGAAARMAGDGPLREALVSRLREENREDWWLGPIADADLAALLAEAEIGVYPFQGIAGVPRVLLEAMASGLAVAASDAGSCREAVRHGENGFLWSTGAERDTVIGELVANPGLRRTVGGRARETVLKNWTPEATLESLEARLRGLMGLPA